MFLGSSTFHVSAPYSTIYSGYAWKRAKCVTSWCIEDVPLKWITIRRTSPRLFCCVMFDCAPMPFPLNLHTLWRSLSHDKDGSFKKAYVEEWVFPVTDTSDLSFSGGQEDVIPETPKVSMPVTSSSWVHRKTRILLALGNVLRHHCLHYSRDLHVSVWNYLSLVMLCCLATRILSHQDMINSPRGER